MNGAADRLVGRLRVVSVRNDKQRTVERNGDGIAADLILRHTPYYRRAVAVVFRQIVPRMTPIVFSVQANGVINLSVTQQAYGYLRRTKLANIAVPNLDDAVADRLIRGFLLLGAVLWLDYDLVLPFAVDLSRERYDYRLGRVYPAV